MLDEKKVRIMTKMSIYEKNRGRYDIRLAKFFRSDYVHYHVLRTLIAVTLGYAILLLLAAVYKSDYLISEAVTLDYAAIGRKILQIYLMILVVFTVISALGYFINYNISRKHLSDYYNLLKKLKKYYRLKEEAEAAEKSVAVTAEAQTEASDDGRNM